MSAYTQFPMPAVPNTAVAPQNFVLMSVPTQQYLPGWPSNRIFNPPPGMWNQGQLLTESMRYPAPITSVAPQVLNKNGVVSPSFAVSSANTKTAATRQPRNRRKK